MSLDTVFEERIAELEAANQAKDEKLAQYEELLRRPSILPGIPLVDQQQKDRQRAREGQPSAERVKLLQTQLEEANQRLEAATQTARQHPSSNAHMVARAGEKRRRDNIAAELGTLVPSAEPVASAMTPQDLQEQSRLKRVVEDAKSAYHIMRTPHNYAAVSRASEALQAWSRQKLGHYKRGQP
jgi:hypothetical protein